MDQSNKSPWNPARSRRGINKNSDPWFTYAAIAACIGIFLSIQREAKPISWDAVAKYGFLPATQIRAGGIHGLFASAFVHMQLLHLAFNMFWLWSIGCRLERSLGTLRYGIFFALAAYVSSIVQLAITDTTGIGASGVVYAIFGYMWIGRPYHREFLPLLDDRTVRLMVGWLFLCIALDQFGVMPIANGAHFGGILFGMGVAMVFARRKRVGLSWAGLLLLFALPTTTLFWAPWSASWSYQKQHQQLTRIQELADKAFNAHSEGRHTEALQHFGDLLELDPKSKWAYEQRGLLHEKMGNASAARADWDHAKSLPDD